MSYDTLAALIAKLFELACTEPVKKKSNTLFLNQLAGIRHAISYIVENYPEKIGIDDLCEVADMSRRSFTDHFKAFTGLTVAEFILSVRLFNATQLLFYKDLLYDDVAKQCGLYNQSNLSRVFTKYLGLTPSQYVAQHKIERSILHEISVRQRYNWLFEE